MKLRRGALEEPRNRQLPTQHRKIVAFRSLSPSSSTASDNLSARNHLAFACKACPSGVVCRSNVCQCMRFEELRSQALPADDEAVKSLMLRTAPTIPRCVSGSANVVCETRAGGPIYNRLSSCAPPVFSGLLGVQVVQFCTDTLSFLGGGSGVACPSTTVDWRNLAPPRCWLIPGPGPLLTIVCHMAGARFWSVEPTAPRRTGHKC